MPLKPADRHLVRDTLKNNAPPLANQRKLELLGEEAFDFIVSLLDDGQMPASHRINALRRLSLLTRQQCVERKVSRPSATRAPTRNCVNNGKS